VQVEEAYIGASEFCARLQQDEAAVLGLEALVVQALNFDLVTHSPYPALAGLFAVCPRLLCNHLVQCRVEQQTCCVRPPAMHAVPC
jgi:hypothetical protein